MNEKETFERICKGDEKALEFLYKKYYRMMTKMVITNSGTEEEARDIYQEALIVFWQKANSGDLVWVCYSIGPPPQNGEGGEGGENSVTGGANQGGEGGAF